MTTVKFRIFLSPGLIYFLWAYWVVTEKIHTHLMEHHWKFQGGGGGVLKAKFLKAMCENKLGLPGRGGCKTQKTFMGGVWIFSGTAHFRGGEGRV